MAITETHVEHVARLISIRHPHRKEHGRRASQIHGGDPPRFPPVDLDEPGRRPSAYIGSMIRCRTPPLLDLERGVPCAVSFLNSLSALHRREVIAGGWVEDDLALDGHDYRYVGSDLGDQGVGERVHPANRNGRWRFCIHLRYGAPVYTGNIIVFSIAGCRRA